LPEFPGILDPMTQATRFEMRLSDELKAMLEELRRAEQPIPSQSEMIRRLIMRGYMQLLAAKPRARARDEELVG
jgi:hypothetical protein